MQNPPTTEEMLAVINDYARACIAGSQTRTPATRRLAEEKATALLNQIQEAVDLLQQPAQAPREYPDIGQHILAKVFEYVLGLEANTGIQADELAAELGLANPNGRKHVIACLDHLVGQGLLVVYRPPYMRKPAYVVTTRTAAKEG